MDNLPRRNDLLVGVKINLKYGHYLLIQVPLDKVEPFIKQWGDGQFKGKIVSGPSVGEITYWAFNGDDVIGIHTLVSQSLGTARALPQQSSPTGFGGPYPGQMSGN